MGIFSYLSNFFGKIKELRIFFENEQLKLLCKLKKKQKIVCKIRHSPVQVENVFFKVQTKLNALWNEKTENSLKN